MRSTLFRALNLAWAGERQQDFSISKLQIPASCRSVAPLDATTFEVSFASLARVEKDVRMFVAHCDECIFDITLVQNSFWRISFWTGWKRSERPPSV